MRKKGVLGLVISYPVLEIFRFLTYENYSERHHLLIQTKILKFTKWKTSPNKSRQKVSKLCTSNVRCTLLHVYITLQERIEDGLEMGICHLQNKRCIILLHQTTFFVLHSYEYLQTLKGCKAHYYMTIFAPEREIHTII